VRRRHPGLARGAGNLDAVDAGVAHAGERPHGGGHFRGGHVLPLPAEGVADAVNEIVETLIVSAHQITGAHPGVARLEHTPQQLALARLGIGVALEARRARLADPADRLAGFV
jgi:hypothetical protein